MDLREVDDQNFKLVESDFEFSKSSDFYSDSSLESEIDIKSDLSDENVSFDREG